MLYLLSFMLAVLFLPPPAVGASGFLENTLWEKAAVAHGVDPALLYAVTIVESARRVDAARVKPWPYALQVNGYNLSFYPQTKQEAEKILTWLQSRGIDNVDVGLGQVNLRWHGHRVRQAADLLEPAVNLRVAAQILSESLAASSDPVLGVGRYHSHTYWRARQYGGRVLGLYRRLLAYDRELPLKTGAIQLAVVEQPVPSGPAPGPPLLFFASRPALAAPAWPERQFSYLMAPLRRLGGEK